jgi:hypothetical protein
MGTWDIHSFANDAATDWLYSLTECEDLDFIDSTLDVVVEAGEDYLGADPAQEAVAAVEILARLRGKPGLQDETTEDADAWASEHRLRVSKALIAKAQKTLDRILTEPSELMDLWRESDEFDTWKNAVLDLKQRVAG